MIRAALPVALALGVLAAAVGAEAQRVGKVHGIGFLSFDVEPSPTSRRFLEGLRELGYTEGRDFVMEYRGAAGRSERLPQLAAELVKARVDVIVMRGTASTMAAQEATRTIPIVFGSAGVPVEKGIAASLARPGGNVTTMSDSARRWKCSRKPSPAPSRCSTFSTLRASGPRRSARPT
jgi:putative ABC transport system substrate-binding protein